MPRPNRPRHSLPILPEPEPPRWVHYPGPISHVVPVEDLIQHRAGIDCPCQPVWGSSGACLDSEMELTAQITVVHNAWDCREWLEEGNPVIVMGRIAGQLPA